MYAPHSTNSSLSYLSSLADVIQTSDEELRDGIGFLSPETVTGNRTYPAQVPSTMKTIDVFMTKYQ